MDLAEILKKTKTKSERVTATRKPPSIATEDRPYSIADSESFSPIFDQKFKSCFKNTSKSSTM